MKNPIKMNLSWHKWLLSGLLLFPLAYLSFKNLSYCSWVVMFPAVFIYLVILGLKTRKNILKTLFYNLSAIFLALFIYEGFLWIKFRSQSNSAQATTTGNFSNPHPYLGYGASDDGIYSSKRTINNETIFDVSYTLKDGLRYTPNSNKNSLDCVLFFGCSVTFGEGLSDTLTLPFLFNKYANLKYKVFNYGFSGYGPHQMLSFIENRVVRDIQAVKNEKIAIYIYFNGHIARAAGYSAWDQKGPKYKSIDGNLKNVGNFSKLPQRILSILTKSFTYKRLFLERKTSLSDLKLTTEIVKKSKELLLREGVILYVFILNDKEKNKEDDYFVAEMKKHGIKTFLRSDAIPDYYKNEEKYILHKLDKHPNGLTNEKIAKYLCSQL